MLDPQKFTPAQFKEFALAHRLRKMALFDLKKDLIPHPRYDTGLLIEFAADFPRAHLGHMARVGIDFKAMLRNQGIKCKNVDVRVPGEFYPEVIEAVNKTLVVLYEQA
ncbi:MAG: hypothetical protein QM537_06070 [Candidatus Symbiobacter sp.]|nr:hypothetical protein [Candidatus Symbiobacter sp.]